VIWHVTMSLDGFIAGPNDSMDWVVAQWSDGGENTRDIDVQRSAVADEVLQAAGAILVRAGLLDEIVVHLVPILLGDGVRLIGAPDLGPVALERRLVATSGQITELRFSVRHIG
jgi:riboflavin biosynthesis pyrimidine reductase